LDLNGIILRRRITREAAVLLYSGIEKEYRQAKLKAARILGYRLLPTNLEVAVELDRIAEESEGDDRLKRLIRMRGEALTLMRVLRAYDPLLIGSVWRGTIHHYSDIDIVVYHDRFDEVLCTLEQSGVKVVQVERVAVTEKGRRRGSFHVYVVSTVGENVEIRVVGRDEAASHVRCETYGDTVVGLRIEELERVLRENPTQRFVPF
jgi:predicted nucleotidyltransferase